MTATPYADAAKEYLRAGFIPIPVKGKAFPEPGTTGYKGAVEPGQVKEWRKSRASRNVAIRHTDTIAIDVDAYGEKHGHATFKAWQKRLGKLPATWSSTSRGVDSKSRQRFYRIPEGTPIISDLGAGSDVEVIHRTHRYSVVAPSVHPDTGEAYAWQDAAGAPSDRPPHIDELPDLPAAWLDALTAKPVGVIETTPVVEASALNAADADRVARWMASTLDGVLGELDALREAAVPAWEKGKTTGPGWEQTTFTKAVRLAEIAKAPWSPLTLEAAHAHLLEHAPRDAGFGPREIEAKWSSALHTARDDLPLPFHPNTGAFVIPLTDAERRSTRRDPDSFFHPKDGLRSELLADSVIYDLALGPDRRVWSYEAGVWRPDDDVIEGRVARLLGDRYRVGHAAIARSVITTSRDLPRLRDTPDPALINTRSGMVDWATGELRPHDAELLSTVQLPIEYDPAATCPRFDRWLSEIVPGSEAMVWEVIGYMVMSGNPLHQAILLHGDGGNGKGTFIRLLHAILGHENTAEVSLVALTEGKFEVADLYGKIANMAGDIDAHYITNSAMFKSITGQDRIQAQRKYGHPFSFTPWAVPLFSANELWRSSDTTEGYFRRWTPIPFPTKVDRSKHFDENALIREVPGIFAHALRSLRDLMARHEFEPSVPALELKRTFELESDIVQVWLREDDRIGLAEAGNTELRELRTLLYERFNTWAKETGHGALNSSNFYKRLERMGYASTKIRGARHFMGIRILPMQMRTPSLGINIEDLDTAESYLND